MYWTVYSRDGWLGSWGLSRCFFFFFFCILRFARAVWWIIEPEYFARGERSWAPPALGQLLPFSWIMQLITLLGVWMDAKSRTFSGTPWPALAGPPVQPLRCHIFQSRPCNRPVSIFFSSCHSSQNPLLPLDMTFHPPSVCLGVSPGHASTLAWSSQLSHFTRPGITQNDVSKKKTFSEKSKRSKYIYNLQLCKERQKERKALWVWF